ncbi:MAG: hypothetical protein ACRCTP_04420 [Aeromonas popoffii]|uniref:hypothetical protein n=1 Tax=Aeromonas popoffii TaxID=70856 RepID=UPI003F3EA94B
MPKPIPASFSLEVEGLTEEALDEFFGKIDPKRTGVATVVSSGDMDLVKGRLGFSPGTKHHLEILAGVIELLDKELEENDLICFGTIKMVPGNCPDSRIQSINFNGQLAVALKAERSHRSASRNSKRINMLSKEIVNLKSMMSDSSEVVSQAFMKSELMGKAFVHINSQLVDLGATPFNPSGLYIPFH